MNAVLGAVDYLRDPNTPGNQVEEGEPNLAERFHRASGQLARTYAICSSSGKLADYRADIAFFEEIRVWMARFDAEERKARGEIAPPGRRAVLEVANGARDRGRRRHRHLRCRRHRPPDLDDAFIARMREQQNPAQGVGSPHGAP